MSFDKNTPATGRIESLLDENSFVELMSNVTARSTDFNLNEVDTPSDGVITGHGLIDGNLVYVYCQDSLVLGGTIGEMHARKIKNIYDLAIKTGAPIISILDSNGIRLQESFDALESLGTILDAASKASGIVPTISCVVGNCGGGLSVLAGLSDFCFMTESANLFLNSPDSIPGNNIDLNDTSNASFASEHSGVADLVSSEDEMFEKVRSLISFLPGSFDEGYRTEETEDDLNRASDVDEYLSNTVEFIKEIADDNEFVEVKSEYGKSMVTGFIRLSGTTIGVVANDFNEAGEFTASGVKKASAFVRFLDSFDIPLLTLTDAKGYERSIESERELIVELSRFVSTLSEADVPKVNLITNNAFGSAYVLMNSKSTGADLVYAYPDAEMGIMDSDKASLIICPDGTEEERESIRDEFEEKSQGLNNALRRGFVDRVIEHVDTRKYLIAGFEMLFSKREKDIVKKHSSK